MRCSWMRWGGRRFGVAVVAAVILAGAGAGVARGARSEMLVGNGVLVLLGDHLSGRPAPAVGLAVVQEEWDASRVGHVLGQDVRSVELPPEIARAGEGPWLQTDDGGLVRLGASGAGFYMTSGAAQEASMVPGASCDASSAVEIAREYVAAHGGLPADAELWSVREVVSVGLSLDDDPAAAARDESRSRRSIGHYVEFRHTVEGIVVDSPAGGDNIKVRIDEGGRVRAYGRVWRTVRGRPANARAARLGAREALASGIKTGGLATSKSRIVGTVRLRDATPVYVSGSRDADVSVLRPAWRFVLEGDSGSQRMYVDAESGETVRGD